MIAPLKVLDMEMLMQQVRRRRILEAYYAPCGSDNGRRAYCALERYHKGDHR